MHRRVNYTPCPLLLQDPLLLNGKVTLHQVTAGTVLSRQGDQVSAHHLEQRECEFGSVFAPHQKVFIHVGDDK